MQKILVIIFHFFFVFIIKTSYLEMKNQKILKLKYIEKVYSGSKYVLKKFFSFSNNIELFT